MTLALHPEDLYHTGIVVPDLDAAKARLSALAGYRWIKPLTYTLPFRTATGVPASSPRRSCTRCRARTSSLSRRSPAAPGRRHRASPSITSATSPTTSSKRGGCSSATASASKMTAEVARVGARDVRLLRRRLRDPHRNRRPCDLSRLSRVPAVDERTPTGRLTCCSPCCASTRLSPHGEPRTQSKLLSTALELAQWGESHGITSVSVDEHHDDRARVELQPDHGRGDVPRANLDTDRERGLRAGAAVESGSARRGHRTRRQHEPRPAAHHGRSGLPHGRIRRPWASISGGGAR